MERAKQFFYNFFFYVFLQLKYGASNLFLEIIVFLYGFLHIKYEVQGKKFVIFIHSPAGLVELKIH